MTVLYRGRMTVATALTGLLIFPQMFLRSIALGGVAVVVVAMVGGLAVLPAMLAVLGRRVTASWWLPRRSITDVTIDGREIDPLRKAT